MTVVKIRDIPNVTYGTKIQLLCEIVAASRHKEPELGCACASGPEYAVGAARLTRAII